MLRDSKFPAKHPDVYSCVTHDLGKVTDYFGICKVRILAPQNLWLPLLPYRSPKTGKLTFSLCQKCVDDLQTSDCKHVIKERAFVGVYTTEELKKAISIGYKVLASYQVWHYKESMGYNPDTNTHGIFSEYVNTFHALKTAASGFPQGCVTLEEKNEYIKKMESGDKIKLDVDKIQKDPALKSVAKALTTNLWGRQAINLKRSQVEYFLEPDSLYITLKSPKVSVDDIIITNEDMIRVTLTPPDDFEPVNMKGNIMLAIFCTSYGRLFLYKFMEMVEHRLLYTDTDSIFYIHTPPDPEIPLGILLGEFKNELDDEEDYITLFACSGLKSYAYLTKKNVTSCHLKGFTFDHDTCKNINLDTMVHMVTKNQEKEISVQYNRIRHDRGDTTKIKIDRRT